MYFSDKYLVPASAKTATIKLFACSPSCSRDPRAFSSTCCSASFLATATVAPEDVPTSTPCSLASFSIVAVLVQIDIPVRVFLCELTGKTHRAVRTFKRIRIDGLGPKEFEHSLPFLTCVLRKYYCDPKADRSSESS